MTIAIHETRFPAALSALPAEQVLEGQGQVLELVARGAPIHESLRAIARFAESSIPSMLSSVLIYDPVARNLRKGGYGRLPSSFCEAIDGMVPGPVMGSCGTWAYLCERVITHDVETDPLWVPFREFAAGYGIRSAWSSPIKGRDGSLLGVFGMYYGDCRSPTEADLAVADHFVHLAAIAIERHRADAERERQATHDELTGLGNRRMLEQAVARWAAMERAPRLSVALVDMDHFHLHNENFGHRTTDLLLAQAAARIAASAAPGDLVVRFEGDRFLLVTEGGTAAAGTMLDRVIAAFDRPVEVDEACVRLSVSAGLVSWSPDEASFDDALFQAHQAKAVAKQRGRECWVAFGEHERDAANERRRIGRLLADAVAERRVVPHLQPVIDLATGRPVGFECLARLTGAGTEPIPPSVFIPIAEESSLIDELGIEMFRETCRIVAGAGDRMDGVTCAVNVSLRQLARDGFATRLAAEAHRHGVAPGRLCIEVTESQYLEGDGPARDALIELKAAGFRLALDDFGTGYASLRQLQLIPFDLVKLDRSFTSRLGDGGRGTALCEAALRMAAACGMRVTAEGIETPEQAAMLRAMRCDAGQGYLWARPMPADQAIEWLEARRAGA